MTGSAEPGAVIADLSVVVLCYRAEDHVVPFVSELCDSLERLGIEWELVLVGNYWPGTADRTPEVVRKLAAGDPRMVAQTEPKQGMMGWDMRHGMEAASGRRIAVIDGDGQFPATSVAECYRLIDSQGVEFVSTYRPHRRDGVYRRLMSRTYNGLFSALFPGLGTRDANSKPKILSRAAYSRMDLHADDWFLDAEMMINVRRLHLPHAELPVDFYENPDRTSFVGFSAVLEFLRNLAVYRVREFRRAKA